MTASDLQELMATELRALTAALGGQWTLGDGTPLDVEALAAGSTPQPRTREVDGALVTIGHRYQAVIERLVAPQSPEEGLSAGLDRAGFRVLSEGQTAPGRSRVAAESERGSTAALQASADSLRVIYATPASDDPSLTDALRSNARASFAARRREDAAGNPYLDQVYAQRDSARQSPDPGDADPASPDGGQQ